MGGCVFLGLGGVLRRFVFLGLGEVVGRFILCDFGFIFGFGRGCGGVCFFGRGEVYFVRFWICFWVWERSWGGLFFWARGGLFCAVLGLFLGLEEVVGRFVFLGLGGCSRGC